MKQNLRILLAGAIVALISAGCEKPGNNGGGGNGGGDDLGISVKEMVSGNIKAGIPGAITILGEGFDENQDYIFVGWKEGDGIKYERINDASLEIRATRVSFGINIAAPYLDKTVKVYVDRPGYDKKAISGDLTFTLPAVSEGYIPDPSFRAFLQGDKNPTIAAAFNACGLLDVAAAAAISHGGSKENGGQNALELGGCPAESFEGIELFSGLKGVIAAWDCAKLKVLDLSKWKAQGISYYAHRNGSLEKIISSPYMVRLEPVDCPKLKEVDCSNSLWLKSMNMTGTTAGIKKLDLRRKMSGTWADTPRLPEQYAIWNGDSFFPLADDAEVKIDAWFLFDHNVSDSGKPSCWADVYSAWKRGATVKVYSCIDIDRFLADAPSYAKDPNALSPNNKKAEYQPANNWQIDDPLTSENEAPVPYVAP